MKTHLHMPTRYLLMCLMCLVHISALAHTEGEDSVDYFANNGLGNSVAIIQHPAGVYANGVTYVSYQGPEVAPYVASYHHSSKQWTGPFKAGNSDLNQVLIDKGRVNSHGKPTMLIDDLGYIHLFYGGHGGGAKFGVNPYGRGGLARNKHAVSKKPYDISEWQDLDNISIFGTYNQAIKMDNGDIYLFYRHGAHRSDWVYQKSSDHGRTFSPAIPFLKTKERTDIKASDSWYIWATKGQGDDIILSYDYHVCWFKGEGPRGRGHITQRHDLYYMVLDTKSGQLRNVQNEPIPFPVTKKIADKQTLVARTGKDWTFNGSSHLDSNGFPHIALNIGKDLGRNTGGPKQTYYFQWNGEKWSAAKPVDIVSNQKNTDTRGDFFIDKASGNVTFLLGYQDGKDGVIGTFTNEGKQQSFVKKQELLRRPNATWSVTAKISHAHPDARIIVAEKIKGQQWHNMYLLGDNGAITRPMSELAPLNK
jgi:hypothetical protein